MTSAADPTNAVSEPTRYWTTANIGEATPDVLSPMCWSFWGPQAEAAARRAYYRFGILSKRELKVPEDVNELMTGYFFGRPALNVDLLRPFFGSLPGVSADDFERDLCGRVRPNLPDVRRKSRLPIIVLKGLLAMIRTPKRQQVLESRQRQWWERDVRDEGSSDAPLDRLRDAADRFRDAFEIHCCGRFVLMSSHAAIAKVTTSSGRPEQFLELLGGLGGVTEIQLADDLWQVSRGKLDLETFTNRHGFHGPNEGNLTAHSWREDAAPVQRLLGALSTRSEDERPMTREASLGESHEAIVRRLMDSLPRRRRRRAQKACEKLVAATQANELSKAAFLMAIDGGRAAARDIGSLLVANNDLDDVEDVFFFTIDELTELPDNARRIAEERRQRREFYRSVSLPVTFTGTPKAGVLVDMVTEQLSTGDEVIRGAAGSRGTVDGTARVVNDPQFAEPLEPGEVLVCRFTDPSWTPLLLLAAGVVIDIGGPASHGAIVARELGIPCVIGTGDGTLRISTGDLLHVDGSSGTVQVIERNRGSS